MKDRIRNLLASGLKPVDISSIVGCSPAYVSQLLSQEDFKKSVQEIAVANAQEKTEEDHLDTRYQNLEHKIISGIEQDLPSADFKEKLRALEVITKRQTEVKRAKMPMPIAPTSGVNVHVVNIALPAHVLQQAAPVVQVNEKNEIISIDNKSLAPMSSTGVKNTFATIMAQRKVKALLDTQQAKQEAKQLSTEF